MTLQTIITTIIVFFAGLFGHPVPVAQPPIIPPPPPIRSSIPPFLPLVISPLSDPHPKKLSGIIIATTSAIIIQGKTYTLTDYTALKTLLWAKVASGTPLKQDIGSNEQAQFFQAVDIERKKCGGRIGAVNGDVVEAMNNLLKNGCPK